VVNALTIFYTLIGVSLFVPIVAGLYVRRTSPVGALAAMIAGVDRSPCTSSPAAGAGAS
jgi:Na+/pantothenate symporter